MAIVRVQSPRTRLTPQALQNRLVEFGVAVCREVRRLPKDVVGENVGRQLVRSTTSPAANYAEACGSQSRRDFVHKLHICLKELRETMVWLQFVERLSRHPSETGQLIRECDELIAIFVKSVNTTKKRRD